MERISDTYCHVFIVKHNYPSFLQDQKAHPQCFPLKVLRRLPWLAFQPVTMMDFATRSWIRHVGKKKKTLMSWIILPFKHVFCVLVVVVWGCCVLGMVLIISTQVTDHRQPRPEWHCIYDLLAQSCFSPRDLLCDLKRRWASFTFRSLVYVHPLPCVASPWLHAAFVFSWRELSVGRGRHVAPPSSECLQGRTMSG